MVCDILLNSNIKKDYKNEVLNIYKDANAVTKLPLLQNEKNLLDKILTTLEEILNISLSHKEWFIASKKILKNNFGLSLNSISPDDSQFSLKVLEQLNLALLK